MTPPPPSDYDEHERELIEILKELGRFNSAYPPELLAARRAAFLAQVERHGAVDPGEVVPAEDQEIVKLLGALKAAPVEYPAHLLAARRAALLSQIERVGAPSVWNQLHASLSGIFQSKTTIPTLGRIAFIIGSLIAALLLGSLFFSSAEQSLPPAPSKAALQPIPLLPASMVPASTGQVAITICRTGEQTPACPPGELDPSQDLAYPGNGAAQPAVSSQSNVEGPHKAAYVNDGRGDGSWVSNSADSWIKIDLGKIATINTVSLRKGSPDSAEEGNPGQFVIAVAVSDVYADGDSSEDYVEYAQVFRSQQTGFSGTVSEAERIKTQFPPVRARFVKITFEKAGAAIEEVGVFMVEPPVVAARPTGGTNADMAGLTLTPGRTNTPSLTNTAASLSTYTRLPTGTATLLPTDTPTPLATNTLPPVDTATPVPTDPLPTATAIPPTVPPSPASTDPIVVTGQDQTLILTCNGDAVEIRGHANTVTLLGSCRSITVTGNSNQVFWQSGSPVITDRGQDNIIQQL